MFGHCIKPVELFAVSALILDMHDRFRIRECCMISYEYCGRWRQSKSVHSIWRFKHRCACRLTGSPFFLVYHFYLFLSLSLSLNSKVYKRSVGSVLICSRYLVHSFYTMSIENGLEYRLNGQECTQAIKCTSFRMRLISWSLEIAFHSAKSSTLRDFASWWKYSSH